MQPDDPARDLDHLPRRKRRDIERILTTLLEKVDMALTWPIERVKAQLVDITCRASLARPNAP
jgi:hypothetical protein